MGTPTACMCAGPGVPAESAPAEVAVDQLQREACRDRPRAAWTAGQLPCCGSLHHASSSCISAAQAACWVIWTETPCGVAVLLMLPACRLCCSRAGQVGAEVVLQPLKYQAGTAVEPSYRKFGSLLRHRCAVQHVRGALPLIKDRWAVLWRPLLACRQLHWQPCRSAGCSRQATQLPCKQKT